MRWIERVERKLERLAIPRIGLWLVAGQVLFYLALAAGRIESADIVLIPNRVLAGEAHRLLTFLFDPPRMHPVFLFFALYLFLLMARGLETQWGAFRFNLFLLTGYVATLGAAFLFPSQPVTNLFLGGSVFLAFAYLHPDFELSLFFLLPVKIKWLAAVTWAGYGLSFLAGPASARAVTLASCLNFFLFFGRDLVAALKTRRQTSPHPATAPALAEPFHRCAVCGRTDLSDPRLDFIYIPGPGGTRCVCRDHADAPDSRTPAPAV
jgi:hypothetical protein